MKFEMDVANNISMNIGFFPLFFPGLKIVAYDLIQGIIDYPWIKS